jgi:CheY-like chemotaxis protein
MQQGKSVIAELWQTTSPNRDVQTPERIANDQGASQWPYSNGRHDALLQTNWEVATMTDANTQSLHGNDEVRVLVMDDSPVVRNLIVSMLEDTGTVDHIVQVSDAPAAVEAVMDEPPRIAILDIKVPGNQSLRNGIDVLRAIKRTQPETEVIMLTNHAIPLYRQTCMDAGASYFFDKSSEFDQLPHAIEEILSK